MGLPGGPLKSDSMPALPGPGTTARACGLLVAAASLCLSGAATTSAQLPSAASAPVTEVRPVPAPRPAPACCGYPYPRALDAEIADGDVHRVLYEDGHIMFLEVANPPLLDVRMHGHPFISVFANDSDVGGPNPAAPRPVPGGSGPMEPASTFNDMGPNSAPAPAGMTWPTCRTAAPQAPHRPFNGNLNPNHFFRIEFLRVEGTEFQTRWREWYPEMAAAPARPAAGVTRRPSSGPNHSHEWPYPIAYDAIIAAPGNYRVLFEDGKVRLVEVTIRPRETTPMHGHPYPSVLAYNSISGAATDVTTHVLDADSRLNGQGRGVAKAPNRYDLVVPTCATSAPEAPHTVRNGGAVPIHYYRIEYKRIDGDGLSANWKRWYPWMLYLPYMR